MRQAILVFDDLTAMDARLMLHEESASLPRRVISDDRDPLSPRVKPGRRVNGHPNSCRAPRGVQSAAAIISGRGGHAGAKVASRGRYVTFQMANCRRGMLAGRRHFADRRLRGCPYRRDERWAKCAGRSSGFRELLPSTGAFDRLARGDGDLPP